MKQDAGYAGYLLLLRVVGDVATVVEVFLLVVTCKSQPLFDHHMSLCRIMTGENLILVCFLVVLWEQSKINQGMYGIM